MPLMKDFKEFAFKGNMIDLAVGVVIGAAFGKVIGSLVDNLFMPVVGAITSGIDFKSLAMGVGKEGVKSLNSEAAAKAASEAGDIVIKYGNFLSDFLSFVVIAFVVFITIVKVMGALKKKDAPAVTTKECPACCMTIPIKATKCGHCTSNVA